MKCFLSFLCSSVMIGIFYSKYIIFPNQKQKAIHPYHHPPPQNLNTKHQAFWSSTASLTAWRGVGRVGRMGGREGPNRSDLQGWCRSSG